MIEFSAPLPPRGLRTNSRTRVINWRTRLWHEYQERVWCAGAAYRPRRPWQRARLELTWYHVGVAPDQDNALASLKALIDVLHARGQRPLAYIEDDGPSHLEIAPVRLCKVRHRADERVEVRLVREEENARD